MEYPLFNETLFNETLFNETLFNETLFNDEKVPLIVHIRIVQRKTKKYITTIEGLGKELNLSKLAKYMRKTFHCQADVFNVEIGSINSKIIKLQGDQRDNIKKFLIAEQIVPVDSIKVHGF
jgi:translation initiation factor 1